MMVWTCIQYWYIVLWETQGKINIIFSYITFLWNIFLVSKCPGTSWHHTKACIWCSMFQTCNTKITHRALHTSLTFFLFYPLCITGAEELPLWIMHICQHMFLLPDQLLPCFSHLFGGSRSSGIFLFFFVWQSHKNLFFFCHIVNKTEKEKCCPVLPSFCLLFYSSMYCHHIHSHPLLHHIVFHVMCVNWHHIICKVLLQNVCVPWRCITWKCLFLSKVL